MISEEFGVPTQNLYSQFCRSCKPLTFPARSSAGSVWRSDIEPADVSIREWASGDCNVTANGKDLTY